MPRRKTTTKSKTKESEKNEEVQKVEEKVEWQETSCAWIIKGALAGYVFNLISLVPLLFVRQLREDSKKIGYFLLGTTPFIIKKLVDIVLCIIKA